MLLKQSLNSQPRSQYTRVRTLWCGFVATLSTGSLSTTLRLVRCVPSCAQAVPWAMLFPEINSCTAAVLPSTVLHNPFTWYVFNQIPCCNLQLRLSSVIEQYIVPPELYPSTVTFEVFGQRTHNKDLVAFWDAGLLPHGPDSEGEQESTS